MRMPSINPHRAVSLALILAALTGCTETPHAESTAPATEAVAATVALSDGENQPATLSDSELRALVEFPKSEVTAPEDIVAVFTEADGAFTRKGLAISPALLREFLTPGVVELDLLRPGNNRNDEDFTVRRLADGCEWALLEKGPDHYDTVPLRYRHIGRTPSGLHVLRVEQPVEGDLGIRCRILLVRVLRAGRPAFGEPVEGVSHRKPDEPTVALRLCGEIELGDRDRRRITVDGEKLVLQDPVDADAHLVVNLPAGL